MLELRAYDPWFRESYRLVFAAVVTSTLVDRATAEEATAEAFLLAHNRWERVGGMENPTGWVAVVAIRSARRAARRQRRLRIREGELRRPGVDGVEQQHRAEYEELWFAVKSLSERQRRAIVLRYVEDLTQDEIARRMDIRPGTVAATLSQARTKLKETLDGSQ